MNENILSIFKAYDIRGKVGSELNEEVALRVGKALGTWLPTEGPVAVGEDMRPDSAQLAKALTAGLLSVGRDVVNIGQVTSDMIYFAVGSDNLAGGAMITASHNPGIYNGIKLCSDQAKPMALQGGLGEVRDLVIKNEFATAETPGEVSTKDITEAWITHVLGFIDATKLTPIAIGVDAGNGMAGAVFPHLEKHVPWQVSELYFELDGGFPNHEANPLKFETLADLTALIRDKQLYGGMAFDGDGDRAFLVDETGQVLTGGVMSAMLADYFLHEHPGSNIVHDARNSHTVPEVISANGGTPIISQVGHSLIKQKMREYDAPFGGEASGHFYFRDNWYADSGLIAAVIGLYVATLSGKKLSELREQYSHYVVIPETNFTIVDKDAAIERIKEAFKDTEQDTLDGVSVFVSADSWFNVRASNTEPTMRLNAEAKTQQELDELVAKVKQLLGS